jgi:adenylosuccinate synthase
LLNGVTELCMTKIDVLNIFSEIKAATHYRYGGREHQNLPFDLCHVDVEPVFKNYRGWNSSLDSSLTFDSLPAEARAYLEDLENYLGVPIKMISTGPEREKLIVR